MTGLPVFTYRHMPQDAARTLNAAFEEGIARAGGEATVFFRADDIAVPSGSMQALIGLFARHRVPLNLAVVPAWLTQERRRWLFGLTADTPELWCWHQHGWRHANHQAEGKKAEFGSGRSRQDIARDLSRGCDRLRLLLGPRFFPAFTPPWNRCGSETLELLAQGPYRLISRSAGARPPCPPGLTEWPVQVDLHTRKAPDAPSGWKRLMEDIDASIGSGFCGFMIHHRCMDPAAFAFLDMLLSAVCSRPAVTAVRFSDAPCRHPAA